MTVPAARRRIQQRRLKCQAMSKQSSKEKQGENKEKCPKARAERARRGWREGSERCRKLYDLEKQLLNLCA